MQVYGQASAPPRGPSLTGFFQILQLAHAGISLTLFRTHTAVMHRTSRHTTHAQPSQAPPSFTCGPPGPKSGKHSGSQPPAPCYLLRLGVLLLATIGCSPSLHHQGCRSTRREGCHASPRRDWSGQSLLQTLQRFCHEAFIGQTGDMSRDPRALSRFRSARMPVRYAELIGTEPPGTKADGSARTLDFAP